MANKSNSNANASEKDNNGLAEKNITGDDMKKFKNALDSNRKYVSGDEEQSSSSHQFSEKISKE